MLTNDVSSFSSLLLSRQHIFPLVLPALICLLFTTVTVSGQRVWVQQGPGPITNGQVENITDGEVVGAVSAVAAHPRDPEILYIGAVNGGIWKTINAYGTQVTWVEQLDLNQSRSIGAIAFDPTDVTNETLMAGAGKFSSFHALGDDRVGVWRTTDGGANWRLLDGGGALARLNVAGVAPRGSILLLAADADDSVDNLDSGVWRSVDTGATWTKISGRGGTGLPAGKSFDLACDPSDPARLFTNAGAWGIYRSDTYGESWYKVSDDAMDRLLTVGGGVNVKITVGASNNVYVAIVRNQQLAGLFRSPVGGERSPDEETTWVPLDLPTTTEGGIHPGDQGAYNLSIAADRTNPNVVYIGGDHQPPPYPNSIGARDFSGRLFRVDASLAPGTQASPITHDKTISGSSPHADSRGMAIDARGNLIETDDGGVYRRTNPLTDEGDWFSLNGDLKVTEFHNIAWDSNFKIVIGGAWDTGIAEQLLPGDPRWRTVTKGDGGDVAVDDGTPGISFRYSSVRWLGGFTWRKFDLSNPSIEAHTPARTVVDGGEALAAPDVTPIALNRVNPMRLIIGGANSVYESCDRGETIYEIGPGIRVNADRIANGPIAYGAAGNPDMLYVGVGNQVYVRKAAAENLMPSIPTGTGQPVKGIAIDPANPQRAFVVDEKNVLVTTTAGGNWENITCNLLDLKPSKLLSIAFSTSNADGRVVVGSNNGVFSARGPAFTRWTPVATGLPSAPVYDLEYDATDEILVAGLLGRGAWTVNLSEPEPVSPVDVVLVLDLSGSMLSPACGTCDSKLQVLKDSVELFVQTWTAFTNPGDRIGVNYFRTNVSEFTVGPDALVPVLPNAGVIINDMQGQTTVPTNLTAMGGGLQAAINRLTDPARPRNIILFTDGMQNVNPMVNPTTFEIANQPDRGASGISPTSPLTDLNTALGIKVNTIGVGATPAFVDLLNHIASETNGFFKLTNAPDEDLHRFFVEALIDVLRQFSPQLLGYRYGTTAGGKATEAFDINGSARRVVFKVSWKRGTTMNFSVLKDGADVTRAGRMIDGPFYKIFVVDLAPSNSKEGITAAGNWRLQLSGPQGARYEAAAIVDEERLKYEFMAPGSGRLVGDSLPLNVRLTFGGQPVTDARVTAQVLAPQQALSNLLSKRSTPLAPSGFQYEPAATDAQRKFQLLLSENSFRAALQPSASPLIFQNNGNGTYSATFTNTSVSGPYTVIFRVQGQRADIGNYDRTESRSVTFRFGTPVLSASSLHLLAKDRAARTGRQELSVRPVDRLGNYLGPDYGHVIAVTVDGVRVSEVSRDVLNGSYVIPVVSTRPPQLTNVTVTIMGRPLYNGPLSGIPGTGASRFALSLHSGVAIPLTGFPSAAKPGLLTELDLEFRITPTFSLEGVYGRYDFGPPGAINSGSFLLKKYFPAGSWRAYVSGGPGVFKPQGGGARFGLTGTAGLNRQINSWLEVDLGAQYAHVFAPRDLGFLGLKGGVKIRF